MSVYYHTRVRTTLGGKPVWCFRASQLLRPVRTSWAAVWPPASTSPPRPSRRTSAPQTRSPAGTCPPAQTGSSWGGTGWKRCSSSRTHSSGKKTTHFGLFPIKSSGYNVRGDACERSYITRQGHKFMNEACDGFKSRHESIYNLLKEQNKYNQIRMSPISAWRSIWQFFQFFEKSELTCLKNSTWNVLPSDYSPHFL